MFTELVLTFSLEDSIEHCTEVFVTKNRFSTDPIIMASYNICLFLRLKTTIKGQRFKDINKTIHNATEKLNFNFGDTKIFSKVSRPIGAIGNYLEGGFIK